jgi:hypothetical protein
VNSLNKIVELKDTEKGLLAVNETFLTGSSSLFDYNGNSKQEFILDKRKLINSLTEAEFTSKKHKNMMIKQQTEITLIE